MNRKIYWIVTIIWIMLSVPPAGQAVAATIQQPQAQKPLLQKPQTQSQPDLSNQLLARPEQIPAMLKQGSLTTRQIPNPHWLADACTACHTKKATAGRANLRQKDPGKLCNTCHETLSAHDYIHVSDIPAPKEMLKRMPKEFRQSIAANGNKMTCLTCHDLPMTCKKKHKKEQRVNSKFFRGGPYTSRTELCYHCHDKSKYKRINAHDQISDKGELYKDKCLICHETSKDLSTAKNIDEVTFNLKDNLARLCWGCHQWKPHPGGSFSFFSGKGGSPNHLVKPSKAILERMAEKEKENDVIFPLEPGTGRVFCATCHNPHERGVIKLQQTAKGADSKNRLRMQQICNNCHDKD